ncbi:thiamine diphosphate-binding protein [Imleria badia]|nr:thiamine diphosphate-binding protein [Imleria badia]
MMLGRAGCIGVVFQRRLRGFSREVIRRHVHILAQTMRARCWFESLLRYADALRTLYGHRAASIDPLDILRREPVATLEPTWYGLTDPSAAYNVDGILWTGEGHGKGNNWSLDQITGFLNAVYFAHLLESEAANRRTHELLARSRVLDTFLQAKFPNLKRYGLEGGESMLPVLDTLFAAAARADTTHIILPMPHRGQLNLLTALFHKIKGGAEARVGGDTISGDVLSHLSERTPSSGFSYSGKEIKVSLLPNPSHLEAVNPVALGKARAKQYSLLKRSWCSKVMCVQLHGDASFTDQGVIMVTLGLNNLPHCTSGGNVHIVVDIEYTTPASAARSSLYCPGVAKMINRPVLHVNGDFLKAIKIAFKYRNYFRKDIVIDLMVYRRWAHNKLDEPAYTQPIMRSVPQLYKDKLVSDGVIPQDSTSSIRSPYKAILNDTVTASATYSSPLVKFEGQWKSIVIDGKEVPMVWPGSKEATTFGTGVPAEVPAGFEIHPRLQRHVKSRLASLDKGEGIDWATAEALAFGTLMLDGCDIRIAGQDVGRGKFSHCHAMLVDQNIERVVVPLNHALTGAVGKLELANSSLSEMAVLGIVIDTFISSAETKWLKQSGMVLLLPHGLDGAGPEHSSSRIEIMLQPLVVTGPKGLLCLAFLPMRVVLVSGKLYYKLAKERATRGLEDRVALVRIEELAPFPFATLADVLEPEWVWVQEEPKNQGALVCRCEATGIGRDYQVQQRAVVEGAFEGLWEGAW